VVPHAYPRRKEYALDFSTINQDGIVFIGTVDREGFGFGVLSL